MATGTASPPKAVSITEAGRQLGVSRATAYRMARDGDMPIVQLGRRKLVPVAWIDDLLTASVTKWEAS